MVYKLLPKFHKQFESYFEITHNFKVNLIRKYICRYYLHPIKDRKDFLSVATTCYNKLNLHEFVTHATAC